MVNLEIREKLPDDALVFDNHAYDNSILGVSLDGRVIYSFERMVDELMSDEGWDELTAIEWIEYNTVRALPYFGGKSPIIVLSEF
jgi:hypothetical protein